MVFSSLTFIFYFLPCVLFFYYIVPQKFRKTRNLVLLVFSLVFYFVGEPKAILTILLSIFSNYIAGLFIGKSNRKPIRSIVLILVIFINCGLLFYFKYFNFTLLNLSNFMEMPFEIKEIVMPIGISFFTFQGLSYVFDVYMGQAKYTLNPLNIALYISLFPQLIAGPIVRYETIGHKIRDRKENLESFVYGIVRFIVGLSKKVLLANTFGSIADEIFDYNAMFQIQTSMAWFGALMFSLQIFFDFSGYSDMAIGLGKMFGFDFLENFNYPYMSKSITDFWRRWHISLSTWFRDYVYIPLGGNKKGIFRHIMNLFIVWFLTGLWHGASWNYIIWGLYYFCLLLLEKYFLSKILTKLPSFLQHFYALFFIMIGWVIFWLEDPNLLVRYLQAMFAFREESQIESIFYYIKVYYPEIIGGLLLSTPIFAKFEKGNIRWGIIPIYIFSFLYSILTLLGSSYNPFIYFRF